jgi:phosphate transport system protein
MSSLTINNNLERIGDIAVNISENILLIKKKPAFFSETRLTDMFRIAKQMLKNTIDAFITENADLAKEVILSDETIDTMNAENHKILKAIMKQSPDNIESALALFIISRQIERLADHSTNIAEDVFFIVESKMIKHKYEKYLFTEDKEDEEE